MSRLIVISGPSCVGKSPLYSNLNKHFPDLVAETGFVVLYNSRAPRPGERDGRDYHFRSREEIESLRGQEGFSVFDVRGDLQALDHNALHRDLETGDVIYEGNPTVAMHLLDTPLPPGCGRLSVFVSPISREEILVLREREDLRKLVTGLMQSKLLRRTEEQKGDVSAEDREEVGRRAGCAYDEMCLAPRFDAVVPNHDGEDSENWTAFSYPVGEAFKTLHAVAALIGGQKPNSAEHWEPDLLP